MSPQAFVSSLYVGDSVLWSFGCQSTDDDTAQQHPEQSGSPIEGEHCLLHMERGGKKGSPKQSSSPLYTVNLPLSTGIFCAVEQIWKQNKKVGLESFLLECQDYARQGQQQPL